MKKTIILLICSILLLGLMSCRQPLATTSSMTEQATETDTQEARTEATEVTTGEDKQMESVQNQTVISDTSNDQELLAELATPYYQEYDEFIEAWLRQQAEIAGAFGSNQASVEYALIVPVLHHPDYKFRLAEAFESGGYRIEYMPADIEDPLDLSVYINQDTFTVKVRQNALLYEEIINQILEDPNAVFDNEIYMTHLVEVEFWQIDKLYDEDFDLADYITFEIRTYTISTETHAVQ